MSKRALCLLVTALILAVSGCGDKDPKPTPTPSGAPSILGSLRDYCEVQGLRMMIADGEVTSSQLPAWADKTVVDGTPRIVDFRDVPDEGHAARLDRLFGSPGLRSVQVSERYIKRCRDETTNADVERTQGGPGYREALDDAS